jgi:hypothetical protein
MAENSASRPSVPFLDIDTCRPPRHRRRLGRRLRQMLPWMLLWGLAWAVFIALMWFLISRPEALIPQP